MREEAISEETVMITQVPVAEAPVAEAAEATPQEVGEAEAVVLEDTSSPPADSGAVVAPPVVPGRNGLASTSQFAALYARLADLFMANQAQVEYHVTTLDPDGIGGMVMLAGQTADQVRYAAHLLLHGVDGGNWQWRGDGPLVDEDRRFALLHGDKLA